MRIIITLNIIIIIVFIYCVGCSTETEKLKNNSFSISSKESQIFKRVSGKDFNQSTGDEIKIALKDVKLGELRQRMGQALYKENKAVIDSIFKNHDMGNSICAVEAYSELQSKTKIDPFFNRNIGLAWKKSNEKTDNQ